MYKNLKAELTRYGISNIEVAKRLNITEGTVSLKLNGKAVIRLEEAFLIQDMITEKSEVVIPIETLFK
jgi:transcriptional regulator with XRE-family HTH domain